jgi:hypothetical protein
MKNVLRYRFAFCCSIAFSCFICDRWASAQSLAEMTITNYVKIVNTEQDLATWLYTGARSNSPSYLEKRVLAGMKYDAKKSQTIVFQQSSFIFFYPATNDWVESSSEMVLLNPLSFQGTNFIRATNSFKTPASYVRLQAPVKQLTVEVALLIAIWPSEHPEEVRYFNRSFWFVHKNKWEEDHSPHPLTSIN